MNMRKKDEWNFNMLSSIIRLFWYIKVISVSVNQSVSRCLLLPLSLTHTSQYSQKIFLVLSRIHIRINCTVRDQVKMWECECIARIGCVPYVSPHVKCTLNFRASSGVNGSLCIFIYVAEELIKDTKTCHQLRIVCLLTVWYVNMK